MPGIKVFNDEDLPINNYHQMKPVYRCETGIMMKKLTSWKLIIKKNLFFVLPEDFVRKDVTEFAENETSISTSLTCRTIRIGSYKFDSKEKVKTCEFLLKFFRFGGIF